MNLLKLIKSKILIVCLLLLLSLLINGNAVAAAYYISPNGSDNNPGTESQPFKTIQKAADIVQAGDTVYIMEGTYPGFWIRDKHGTANAWIVFKPYPGHNVISDPYINNYNPFKSVEIVRSSYIEVNGFEITDSNPAQNNTTDFAVYSQGLSKGGISTDRYSSYIRIINNHIHHTGGNTIYSGYDSHHFEILNNYIHDVGWSKRSVGMYLGGDDHIIRGNIIHDAYGYGIHVYSYYTGSYGSPPDRILVENNIVYNNGREDYGKGYEAPYNTARGDGITVMGGGGRDSIIRNNIVHNNLRWGIRTDSINAKVEHNVAYNNGFQGIYVYDGINAIARNNISSQNKGGGGYPGEYHIGPGNTKVNNLFGVDPEIFEDAAKGNFRLKRLPDSLAIDKGATISEVKTDIDGNPRPIDGDNSGSAEYDIGPYEYTEVVQTYQCNDGIDNDGDSFIDYPSDPGCSSTTDNEEYDAPSPSYQCSDGIDNDGDNLVDYPSDPGCSSTTDNEEYNAPPQPSQNSIISLKTQSPIIIDGNFSENVWSKANYVTFSNPSRSDNQVKVYTLWDDNNLYFAYDVSDPNQEAVNGALHKDDGAEIYLDTQNNKTISMDVNDYLFIVNINDQISGGTINTKTVTSSKGFTMEIAIPWTTINTTPSSNLTMGLLLGNNDRDNGQSSQFDWLNLIETGYYSRPNLWGDIILSSQLPVCNSFTYSEWSVCQPDNTQTRTVISSSPQDCTGGNPVLTQSCAYIPPTCTLFEYSAWSACQPDNTQTRTVISSSPQGCTEGNPVLTQSCTYTSPPSQNSLTSLKTQSPITIDGNLSENVWSQANYVTFTNPSRSDNQAKVYTLWDDGNLYFAYDVTDPNQEAVNETLHKDDGAEIYLDTKNNKTVSMDVNDYLFIVNINDQTFGGTINTKTITKSNGFTIEIAIPWTTINTTPSSNQTMGLLLGNNDRDNGQSSQFDWLNLIETGYYSRPNLWGDIVISDEQIGMDVIPPAQPLRLKFQ
jgi:parallel beta-helix repeat protein